MHRWTLFVGHGRAMVGGGSRSPGGLGVAVMTDAHLALFIAVIIMTGIVGFLIGLTVCAWFVLHDRREPPSRPNRRWTLIEWCVRHGVLK
jgi:hypothetical protein